MNLIGGAGDPTIKNGVAYYSYAAGKSMEEKSAFYSADGDWLIGECIALWFPVVLTVRQWRSLEFLMFKLRWAGYESDHAKLAWYLAAFASVLFCRLVQLVAISSNRSVATSMFQRSVYQEHFA